MRFDIITDDGIKTHSFSDIYTAMCHTSGKRSYFARWKEDEELMEDVLYDLIRTEYKGYPESAEFFNMLVNAMIAIGVKGNPSYYLGQDPADLWRIWIHEQRTINDNFGISADNSLQVRNHRLKFRFACLKNTMMIAERQINHTLGIIFPPGNSQ